MKTNLYLPCCKYCYTNYAQAQFALATPYEGEATLCAVCFTKSEVLVELHESNFDEAVGRFTDGQLGNTVHVQTTFNREGYELLPVEAGRHAFPGLAWEKNSRESITLNEVLSAIKECGAYEGNVTFKVQSRYREDGAIKMTPWADVQEFPTIEKVAAWMAVVHNNNDMHREKLQIVKMIDRRVYIPVKL